MSKTSSMDFGVECGIVSFSVTPFYDPVMVVKKSTEDVEKNVYFSFTDSMRLRLLGAYHMKCHSI